VRAFISFLTDFGADGAAAICRGVMLSIAPDAQIVDISHGVRKFAIREGAYLLWMSVPWMPTGIHVAIVDPGVGTDRRPIGIRTMRGDVLIGPDNGLLMPAATELGGISDVRVLSNTDWMLPRRSATFHGRDVFAPMAGHLAAGGGFDGVGPLVERAALVDLRFSEPVVRAGILGTEARYVDSFGNIRLGARPEDLEAALGKLAPGVALRLSIDGRVGGPEILEPVIWGPTFASVPLGGALLYVDSSGQLALGFNQADAAATLAVEAGRNVRIELL
jgi:S-adenosyl-L-methionine hydrolase (adenosine-forming)